MKNNEFRIGNLITMNGKVCRIAKITDKKVHKYISPIPLTENWLLKLGFEFDTITFSKGLLMFSPSSNWDKSAVWYGTLTHGRIDVEMKYVHQLQNLYFALTGIELQLSST